MLNNTVLSKLTFESRNIVKRIESNPPKEIYRYFSTEEDRENFLQGDVWFAGPSTNRFTPNGGDIFEYRTDSGVFVGEYALSFSTEIIGLSEFNICCFDIKSFINEIEASIKNLSFDHAVSWHPINELTQYINVIPTIAEIKDYPTKDNEEIKFLCYRIGGEKIVYTEKQQKNLDLREIPSVSYNKNKKFESEKEYRIYLGGEFLQGQCLANLVKHLRIKCVDIRKYFRVVD